MPALALAIGGAAIGYAAVGTTFAVQVGWMVGSLIGSSFAPKQQGPRLADLKASAVSYGAPVPYVEGHPRLAGVLIWQSVKREIANDVGGKGGGGGATSYTYECDVLIMLAENSVGGIRRVWSNGDLVWTIADESDDDSVDASDETDLWQEIIFYPGDEDQMPDPTYEAAVGAGNAPAYRGHATVMIKGLQLGGSGQLPNITFEISGPISESGSNTTRILTEFAEAELLSQPPTGSFVCGSQVKVSVINGANVTTYTSSAEGITTQNDPIPAQAMRNDPASGSGNVAVTVFGLPEQYAGFAVAGSGISRVFTVPDPGWYLGTSEIRFAIWGERIAVGTREEIGAGADAPEGAAGNPGFVYIFNIDGSLEVQIALGERVSSLALFPEILYVHIYGGEIVPVVDGTVGVTIALPSGSGHRIFAGQNGVLYCANAEGQVHRYESGANEWALAAELDYESVDMGTANCVHAVSSPGDVFALEMYPVDRTGSYLFWYSNLDNPGELASRYKTLQGAMFGPTSVYAGWFAYARDRPDDQGLRPRRNYDKADPVVTTFAPPETPLQATCDWAVQVFWYYGELVPPDEVWLSDPSPDLIYYQALSTPSSYQDYFHNVYRHRARIGSELTEPTLEEVVENQCSRGGLDLDDVNAVDLATRNVRAMAVTQTTSPRQIVETLSGSFAFNVKEANSLVFEFLGGAPVATIPFDDLGADGEAPFVRVRSNDLEIPSQVTVRYSNVDDDYQDGSESSDRLISVGKSIASMEIPIGFTPLEARRIADILVLQSVASNTRVQIALSRKYSHLQAGDVLLIEDEDGSTYRTRSTRCTYENGVYRHECVLDDASVYSSDIETSGGYGNSTTVLRPPDTEMEMLDIPLLRDADDAPGLYIAAKGSRSAWPGYQLMRSPDNISYTNVLQSQSVATMGECTSTLGTWTGGNMVDERNKVTVDVGQGTLQSITRQELFTSRLNACLIGDEIVQFEKATQVSPGVYTISRLIRGIAGTSLEHSSGERFVLLTPSSLARAPLNFADLAQQRYFKAVTLGRNASTATGEAITPELVSQKPIAPWNLHAVRKLNDDIIITWNRRTRYSSNSVRGLVPLGEVSESYSVDVMDGESVLRTISVTDSQATYTAAQQAADGVGTGTDLHFQVRQIGTVPGFPANVSMEV